MTRKLQIKRGKKNDMPILAEGELGFVTDERTVYIGTGDENVPVTGVKATTLKGYGITDAYTKTEIDGKDYTTKEYVDNLMKIDTETEM